MERRAPFTLSLSKGELRRASTGSARTEVTRWFPLSFTPAPQWIRIRQRVICHPISADLDFFGAIGGSKVVQASQPLCCFDPFREPAEGFSIMGDKVSVFQKAVRK